MMTVVQCWDDGVTTDVRLVDILRRHGAKATFNLSDGLYAQHRSLSFVYQGVEVRRLGRDERRAVYDGFTIANHSLTHPRLDQMPVDAARREITEGRERLQQFFGQPVPGFAYPFGSYNDAVVTLVREAGHVYGRTDREAGGTFPPENPMLFHPNCHFLALDLWSRYENARESGVFYFWGHSYEMTTEAMWNAFEEMIRRIGADPDARWSDPADLFAGGNP
ncbi:MAG TPA: polysaccharide deacetylase family protein [Syntrophales bacterium]|nr:polysaccharide deacetylase family protein [Syntrophales bacterium]